MDGNRRYGKSKYGAGVKGHSDGSRTLVNFTDWCIDAGIVALTVFAFSTGGLVEGKRRAVRARADCCCCCCCRELESRAVGGRRAHEPVQPVHARDRARSAEARYPRARAGLRRTEAAGVHRRGDRGDRDQDAALLQVQPQPLRQVRRHGLRLCVVSMQTNVILDSYGARDEIVGACKKIAKEVANGETSVEDINEELLSQRMLTAYVLHRLKSLQLDVWLIDMFSHLQQWPPGSGRPDPHVGRAAHQQLPAVPDRVLGADLHGQDVARGDAGRPAGYHRRVQPPQAPLRQCFAVGVELGAHKKSHRYTVSDCLAFPIVLEPRAAEAAAAASVAAGTNAAAFPADAASSVWTADEELLLLEGIEMFGMGNWKDIAEHVATKSDKKCERHYLSAYLGRKDLMPRFIGDALEESKDEEAAGKDKQASTDDKAAEMNAASDHVLRGPLGERNGPNQLAGYMPLRGDFDVEYDNEAEMILADMEFSDADHPAERELKLKVIQIYNQKLEKRMERKKFVVERGLLDYKLHQHTERKRPKEERELLAQVRPFARFQSPEEHDNFVEGLIAAMRLKKQILLLQEYRKNGVRTLAEAELYDADKKKRELDQAIQKQRDSASYLYESGRTSSSGRDRANRWQNRDQGANGDAGGDSARTRGAASGAAGLNSIAATFSIDGTPGCHLLTPKEKELCSKLKLLPKCAVSVPRTDVNKTGQVYDFFVKCGWVKSESATPTVAASLKTKSPKKGKKPLEAAPVIATKEEQSVTSPKPATPAKRKAAEMEAGSGIKL
ncbi:unnamed protein product [Phytophthora fragariaefolia]|uniref:Unnamed protein product n=1 Tax=Phytophthora fragariaefolia TaxID=1490495 RepID=A0A9W7CYA8_9STRA|nr:unnamed protein product [Phytophthora fragariaefolia]